MHFLPLVLLCAAAHTAAGGARSATDTLLSSEGPRAISNETAEHLNKDELLGRPLDPQQKSSSRLTRQPRHLTTRRVTFLAAVAATLAAAYIFYLCFRDSVSQRNKTVVPGTRRLAAGGSVDSDDENKFLDPVCSEKVSRQDDMVTEAEELLQKTAELAEETATALTRKQEEKQLLLLQVKMSEEVLKSLQEQVGEAEKVLQALKTKAEIAEKVVTVVQAKVAQAANDEEQLTKKLELLNAEFADREATLQFLSERAKAAEEGKPQEPKSQTKWDPKKAPEHPRKVRTTKAKKMPQVKRWSTYKAIPDYEKTVGAPAWAAALYSDTESGSDSEMKDSKHGMELTPALHGPENVDSPSKVQDAGATGPEVAATPTSPEGKAEGPCAEEVTEPGPGVTSTSPTAKTKGVPKLTDAKPTADPEAKKLPKAKESGTGKGGEGPPLRPPIPTVEPRVLEIMKKLAERQKRPVPPRVPSKPPQPSGAFHLAKMFFESMEQGSAAEKPRKSFSGSQPSPLPSERQPSLSSETSEQEYRILIQPDPEASPIPEEQQPEAPLDGSVYGKETSGKETAGKEK